MSLIIAAFGMGLGWMGLVNRKHGTVTPPSGTTGQPMGLLLALTHAS